MTWAVGVDVGGTFTDFYAFEESTGQIALHKTPSTPSNPAEAIVEGLRELCAAHQIDVASLARVSHGTTVATNALLQRRGGRVVLLTTRGFQDLLEVGRQIRPHMYDMQLDFPAALVPRQHRVEIAERMQANGQPRTRLTPAALAQGIDAVRRAHEADACAVCFLFSFVNSDHEQQVGQAIRTTFPNMFVSLSCEVQPEFREYERLSTTVLNAYLQPVMDRYLGSLETKLTAFAPAVHLGINQSNGGLMSVLRARSFPVRTALSGPAAGVVGAAFAARSAGRPNVITLDMGGTSADVCMIRDYSFGTGFDRSIGGFPIRLPMVDVHTVGAGGGSIAWFDRDELLHVGPTSAGADPGPACYGRGGTLPTVTDANVVLGRLSPRGLLGGRVGLDTERARQVFEPIAARLDVPLERAALGVVEIVVSNMVRAIRAVSVERGYDPRQCSLMPFGGAGPLHAAAVARSLGIQETIVPPLPGILCAQGLMVSDLREDFVRTVRIPLLEANLSTIERHVARLRAEALDWFQREAIPENVRHVAVHLDMRYVGQNFELIVPVTTAKPCVTGLQRGFYEAHERQYGYHNTIDPIEIVNIRATALGRLPKPALPSLSPGQAASPTPRSRRDVWFASAAPVDTPIYEREDLHPGQIVVGPAIIEQLDATTVVVPGDRATVDSALNLIIAG